MTAYALETRTLSSLAKVFTDCELLHDEYLEGSALLGESYSFQVAYRSTERIKDIRVQVSSDLDGGIELYRVGHVPSEFPIYHDHDEHVIRTTPGLYPDPLYPNAALEGVTAVGGQWRAVWITVQVKPDTTAGAHPISIRFESKEGEALGEACFRLNVISSELPKQRLIHTEWFYADCIMDYYETDMFSEAHWSLIEKYVETASQYGINMILTPIFTPPLDTKVGGERTTTQLVDVTKTEDSYTFGFEKLERWIALCQSKGIEYFEFSHLFTQWGAGHAPKIMGTENGEYKRLFGWETDAAGDDYRSFLDQFLPELVAFIRERKLEKLCYFHISDEPYADHMEAFKNAVSIVEKHLSGFPRIDALSNIAYYEEGLVPKPIPASNHIEPFLERGISGLWTYYCCSQYKETANRFFCFPSARSRILGIQLYKFQIEGFLHWGFNFWNSQFSLRQLNPFEVTDCDLSYPSGDAFLVYPGESGPIPSLRMKVVYEAKQDLRALQLLEGYMGRDKVIELLEEGLEEPITFKQYPRSEEWLLGKRAEINNRIGELAGK
ncbi:DUF4091 domain-containing protein [Paenibacillus sp. PL2-23]|uniref:DUF4091 domain-containing protein n=1 Tax=Paenibacillus sp. PL2-23 TaxID=2100729 RepID=UPI0030FCED12